MPEQSKHIPDDEFRVIQRGTDGYGSFESYSMLFRGHGISLISAFIVIALGIWAILSWPNDKAQPGIDDAIEAEGIHGSAEPVITLGCETELSFTEKIDTVINDVQLSLYIPHNAVPQLIIGTPPQADKDIILIVPAADISEDTQEIIGSFILDGEIKARGTSREGYCAIIDGKMTIGVGRNSPLFEEAVEKSGCFFRQYPLVDNGIPVDNAKRGKDERCALCSRAGEIFIAVSETAESYHDFAQALSDLGIDNAINLSSIKGVKDEYRTDIGDRLLISQELKKRRPTKESIIIWTVTGFFDLKI